MEYADIFAARGSDYDRAMRAFPTARDAEFQQLIERGCPQPGDSVLDVPAGGGYLAGYLPPGCRYLPHEPCAAFGHGGQATDVPPDTQSRPLLPLPWAQHSIDLAISLAGVHHLEDKAPLFAELWRVVRPGGRLVLCDVAADSPVAAFLDGVVGAYNATGHAGHYLTPATARTLEDQGWRVLADEHVACDWRFVSSEVLGEFCHGLFGMHKTTPERVSDDVAHHLGIHPLAEGGVYMPWSLQTLVCER